MHRYRYAGAVTSHGRLISEDWQGETLAATKDKARSNLIYRCKRDMHLLPTAKIEFLGNVKMVEANVY